MDMKAITVPKLHPKNQLHKERLLTADHWLCMERAKFYTDTFKETEGEHPPIRTAMALKRTFENMTVRIYPEEILVGNRASEFIAPPFACERGDINFVFKYRLKELEKFGYKITPEHRKILFKEIIPYWTDKSVRHFKVQKFKENNLDSKLNLSLKEIRRKFKAFNNSNLIATLASDTGVVKSRKGFKAKLNVIGRTIKLLFKLPRLIPAIKGGTADNVKGRGRCTDTQAHIVVGYKNVLKLGFKGIKEKASARLKTAESDRERAWLRSVEIVCDAMRDFSMRFSNLAKELAEEETDSERKEELLKISKICEHVPWNPPQGFHEAIQSMWFVQNAAIISYGLGSGITPGRVDQLLYPFYKKDMEMGNLSREDALRLAEEFIVKINNNVVIWPNIVGVRLNHLGSDVENITVGGVDRNGEDATNDLTYVFIDAIGNVRLATSSTFRISKKSPPEYLQRVVELYKKTSGPAFYNDETVIKTLMNDGYTLEDARDYCIIGCVEPSGNGDTFGATGGTKLYLPTILDMVFNRGRTSFFGNQDGPDTGDPVEFTTFNEFMDAFYKQMEYVIGCCAEATRLRDAIWEEKFNNPLISCTIDGCIENAKDMTAGGARYNFMNVGAGGLGTTIDSLVAIKKFVYEEKTVKMEDIVNALQTNFKNDEVLRQKLSNGPKYGNDHEYVDSLAVEIVDKYCDAVKKEKLPWGGHFKPSFSSYGLNVYEGFLEPATPNGRKATKPLSNSISPCNGAEMNGPTAAIKSIAKVDHTKIGYGDAFNMKFPLNMLNTQKGMESLENLIKTYFDLGGFHVQFNIIGTETLLDAQNNPEQYADLIVRVSGYSAYFTRLGKAIQDDLIDRVEFTTIF